MSNLTKKEHFKCYLKLKQQECIIERSVAAFIANSKINPELEHNIKQDFNKYEPERQKIVESLKETVTLIYEELKAVKALISEDIKTIDLESFKNRLQFLWKKIEEFKTSINNNIVALNEEQNSLNTDLSAMVRTIRKHKNFISDDKLYGKPCTKVNSQKKKSDQKYDYDEGEDFCSLLAKTGHIGNWSEEDHLLYLKLAKRHKSIPALVRAIQAKCPDLTKECIVNHVAWHRTYLRLRDRQKEAVQQWRRRREHERLDKIARASDSCRTGEPRSAANDAGGGGCRRVVNHAPAKPSAAKLAEQRKAEAERKKELVREWKERREKQRAAEEELVKNRRRIRSEYKESRRRARASKLRRLVAEHRDRKAGLERTGSEPCCVDGGETGPMSALILKVFRARDEEFLEKRRSVLLAKAQQAQPVQPVRYDFCKPTESTLLKETKAWQEKLCRSSKPKAAQPIIYIKDLPKRAMASWRNYEITESFTNRQR